MKILLYLTLLFSFSFVACKTTKSIQKNQEKELLKRVELFVAGFNNRDASSLNDLFHKEYQSLSPVHKPPSITTFIKQNLDNLDKNNFEVAIQIKEIEIGNSQAYVSMNWQLKTKGAPREDDPFANVQRVDIWKLDLSNKWRIFRTIIYNEKAF